MPSKVRLRLNIVHAVTVCLVIAFGSLISSAQRASAPPSRAALFPLRVSENKRYLVDRNGRPFLIVADTPQGIMARLTEEEAEDYFADREAHGFNTMGWIDVACAGSDYPANPSATTPDGIQPFLSFLSGGVNYEFYDLSKPNEAYFVRLDHMIQRATRHDFAVFIDPIETIGWLPTLRRNGLSAAYEYGRFLGHRYSGYANVMWLNGNDFRTWHASETGALTEAGKNDMRSFPHAWLIRNDDALVQAVARGIRDTAPQQLQTVELEPPTTSSFDDPAWRTLVEINGTYTYYPAYIQTLHSYNQTPVAPTFLMETRYEFDHSDDPPGDQGDPYTLRKQEYWATLSGATGQFYGNALVWPFKDGWREKFDTVGAQEVGYWKNFFISIPWQNLVPDENHAILVDGTGPACEVRSAVSECAYAVAAKTSDSSIAVFYLPTPRTVTVNLAALSHPVRARWFDPTSGTYKAIGGGPFPNSGTRKFSPPGKNHSGDGDWVLLLDAAKNSPRKITKQSAE